MTARKKYRTSLLLSFLLIAAQLLSGCGTDTKNAEPQKKVFYTYFDTVTAVSGYAGDDEATFEKNCNTVEQILDCYNRLLDIYHEYSGMTNLCTVNRNAGGEPVQVPEELTEFLRYAVDVYALTDGKLNIALGPVLSLWHACREAAADNPAEAAIPDEAALRFASAHTDISKLIIDDRNSTVSLRDPDASLDVGALGKGYAVEKAAQALEAAGVTGYVINAGGNIRCIGTRPDGTGWKTGLTDPNNPGGDFAATLLLSDTSCVTSGIYERYYTVDGTRYHHIIDPETLCPASSYASVTVIYPDSGLADALSTALFCMSPEEGSTLAESMNAAVLWIYPDGTRQMTDGMKRYLQ